MVSIPPSALSPQIFILRYTLSAASVIAAEVRMPTLVLPPRITPDTDAMREAAQAAAWEVLRLDSWRVPAGVNVRDVVLYGEPLFADVVAPSHGIALLQAPCDWLRGLR